MATRRVTPNSPANHPKYDTWRVGIIVGFALPLLVFGITILAAWLRLQDAFALRSYLLVGGTLGRLVAIGTFFNVIPHGWFVHKETWQACRGTILSTIILASISIILHFLRAKLEGL